MQARIADLPAPAVAGGLALLGGLLLWQLGIEFERAWMRSYDGPLLGDSIPENHSHTPQLTQHAPASPSIGKHRRWVINHHPRAVPSGGARGHY